MRRCVLSPSAARAVKSLLRGNGEVERRTTNTASVVAESDFAAPFTVQWAQSVGNSGSWIIWLPGSSLVMWGGTALDVTEDLSAAGDPYPSGWYSLADVLPATGGTLYLLITLPQEEEESGSSSGSGSGSGSGGNGSGGSNSGESETDEVTAEFSATVGTTTQLTIPICRAATNTTTHEKTVKQYVTSLILIAGATGATSSGAFPFTAGMIGAGAVTVGRQSYKVNEDGTEVDNDYTGDYRVSVTLDEYGGDPTIEVEEGDGFDPQDGLTSYFPLYTFEDGKVTADWRGTFVVPVWEMVGGYGGSNQ